MAKLPEQLKERGLNARRKTIEGILEFADCMLELKNNSNGKQGGTDFSKTASDWWGIPTSSANQWVAIANKKFNQIKELRELNIAILSLPPAIGSLYLLSTIENKDLEANIKAISSNMSQEDVKALKRKIIEDKVEKENPNPNPNPNPSSKEEYVEPDYLKQHREKEASKKIDWDMFGAYSKVSYMTMDEYLKKVPYKEFNWSELSARKAKVYLDVEDISDKHIKVVLKSIEMKCHPDRVGKVHPNQAKRLACIFQAVQKCKQ